MDNRGYTLVEALAALLMIGLALTGMTEAVHVFGKVGARLEAQHHRAREMTLARSIFTSLPDQSGPYRAGEAALLFVGDADQMTFACGQATPCAIALRPRDGAVDVEIRMSGEARRVTVRPVGRLNFAYVADSGGPVSPVWPVETPHARLAAVVLYDGLAPLAIWRLPAVQQAACAFDIRLADCAPSSEDAYDKH